MQTANRARLNFRCYKCGAAHDDWRQVKLDNWRERPDGVIAITYSCLDDVGCDARAQTFGYRLRRLVERAAAAVGVHIRFIK